MQIDAKRIKTMAVVGNAVLTKAVMMLGLGWGGNQLDKKWGTFPWLTFLGVIIGMALGLWYVFIVANRLNKEKGSGQ